MSDAQLVRDAIQGRTSAYEELVARWAARLLAYIRARVVRLDVAEDLTQDCLIKAFENIQKLERPEKFGPWLLSIGHNACVDWRKARARGEIQLEYRATSETGYTAVDCRQEPAHLALNKEKHLIIREAINELPENQRETILIYYYDRVTYNELAEMLGISPAAVNARLAKAREALRKKLGADWVVQ